jgi:hypothetical protein
MHAEWHGCVGSLFVDLHAQRFGTAGSQTITAGYGGDSTHADSSGSQAVTVDPRSARTTVSCSPNPVAVGRSTTCTATVTDTSAGTASTPTGTVRFSLFSNDAGSFSDNQCTLTQTSPGVASCAVTYTPSAVGTGSHTIVVQYGGDSKHAGNILSFGETSVTVIAPRSTSTGVSCSPNPVAVGTTSTCTATVSDTDAGAASTPTGSVGFATNGPGSFSAGSCTLSETSAGVANCSVSYTPTASGTLRTDTITASSGGDSTHAGSSATAAVAVQPTSRADCRHGGWQNYGFQNQRQCIQFVNGSPVPPISKTDCLHGGWRDHRFASQGDCVAFVATGGKNEPGKNIPTPKEP